MDYNIIYDKFLDLCGYSESELPKSDLLRYRLINNGVDLYNECVKNYEVGLHDDLMCDDVTETLNYNINNTELLILAYCMCESISSTKYAEFVSLYSVEANEMGLKDYKAQKEAKQSIVDFFHEKATKVVENQISEFNL